MQTKLDNEIQFLAGVGPKKAETLKEELSVKTIADLLQHFPFRYIDRRHFNTVSEVNADSGYVQLKGKISQFQTIGKGRAQRATAQLVDQTGSLELVWFKGVTWLKSNLKPDKYYVIFGKPTTYGRKINLAHPEMEEADKFENSAAGDFMPVYNTSEKMKKAGINTKAFSKIILSAIAVLNDSFYPESLPAMLIQECKLMGLKDALVNIHFPQSRELLQKAETRIKFEELFYIQLNLLKQRAIKKKIYKGAVFEIIGENFNHFYNNCLPFELTNAQKRVVKEIRHDLKTGKQMNRLVQGDVGSGKTLVALLCMLIAIDNGYQTCLMAPTEILASQHFKSICEFLGEMNVNIRLLTGSTKKAQRTIIHEELLNGKLQILIGTHALLEDIVQFKNLGLAVIDEQHRFGVAQRAKLWKKNSIPPHILVMTATPIPRTLAMTLYGDLDVSVIDELPPGRKPIHTVHYFDSSRLKVFGFMKKQIELGRQIYVVYPLIKESEAMDYKDLEDGYESICRAFPRPEYQVSVVHGKMKPEDKDFSMKQFAKGETQIMVATTVIEVGVNVPNASVMVIESSERFGLSQLHQLRGRVGRGADQSYCILMTGYKLSEDSRKRIKTMCGTNDGFEISEADLKLRGPGDIEGTQQSGVAFNLKLANLAKDGSLLQYARDKATEIIEKDPELQSNDYSILARQLDRLFSKKIDWSNIS